MRKNINKTTVVIILAIFLTISVGYALFSDTITIEGTATAKGNFDIKATCLTTIPEDLALILDSNDFEIENKGYNNESCTVIDDKVTYSVGLEYPGAIKWHLIKLTNVGSIDGKLLNLEDLTDDIGKATVKTYNSKTNELISTEEETSDTFIDGSENLIFQKKDGSFVDNNNITEDDSDYFLDKVSGNLLIREGASIYIVFNAKWPNKEKYLQDGVYYEATQTIEFQFEQYNG